MNLVLSEIAKIERTTKSKSEDAHAVGVGFYSLKVVWCLAIPGKNVDEVRSPRFLFLYFREKLTIFTKKTKNMEVLSTIETIIELCITVGGALFAFWIFLRDKRQDTIKLLANQVIAYNCLEQEYLEVLSQKKEVPKKMSK